jgi:hypothetical protein
MKKLTQLIFAALLTFCSLNAPATTHYVDAGGTNATPPYTDWTTAAVNIQDAIDASTNGDIVLVTNGVYAGGGRVMIGGLTNRVALTNAITVQSVNGPWVTTIQGVGTVGYLSAVRCAWLTNNATLTGFTLEWGTTSGTDAFGGGVWCASSNAVVNNCVIVSNTAVSGGAGVFQGTLNNCLVSSNGSRSAGGVGAVMSAILNSCTIVSNGVGIPGVYSGTMTNCIVYYNNGGNGMANASAYCCTTPLPAGKGNFTNAPQLFADGVHLLSISPCIGAGTNLVTGTDIFGQAWANPPSVGCAEYNPSPVITQPQINLVANLFGFAVNATAGGPPPVAVSWLKDGVPLQDNGHYSFTQTPNLAAAGVSLADAGSYQLVASNAFGVVTSAVAQLAIHCVDAAGTNPVAPYSTWETAATDIQDAITASLASDIVLVTNGLYAADGKSMDGVITNRVSVDKTIRVQSVNGPWVTAIQGVWDPVSTNGPAAVRCAWLTNNAALIGFTLEGGATRNSGAASSEQGGGVWCASSNVAVANCVIVSNTSYSFGTGAYQGTLNNCLIHSNGLAGGSWDVYQASVNNCTIVGNNPDGTWASTMTNCIVYYNNYQNSTLVVAAAFCCTIPLQNGPGNFTNAPQLSADGVHLSSASPCIGAGTNLVIGTDIFGQPWANPPSIGCAEYNPAPTVGQPHVTLTGEPAGFQIGDVAPGGQPPFAFIWLENGVPLQNNGQFNSTQSSNLVATGVSLADSGSYQLVVSNAFGMATSAVAQLVIHAVDAAGVNPEPPFSTWGTAATNINDAINAASAGDIVLVTNGIYGTGGVSMDGVITNRVVLNNSLMVVSVNGWANTVIQGAWDPVSTNGPAAVRCAWLTNGAVLSGFALQNGATRGTGTNANSLSGGGVWCASTNALVSNCLLTNNAAPNGGGIAFGTLDNCLVVNNLAGDGGGCYSATLNNCLVVSNMANYGCGAYNSTLNNCTVVDNSNTNLTFTPEPTYGAGTYYGLVRNSIVLNNYDFAGTPDNYVLGPETYPYVYSCTSGSFGEYPQGPGNIGSDPQFVDYYHLSIYSPCRGAGSPLYASGTDFNGQPWNNPPSMGCAEVVVSNRVGPLSVAMNSVVFGLVYPPQTNVLVNHRVDFTGTVTGLASYLAWNFGDGPDVTNADYYTLHYWTNTGVYNVVLTAYNDDNPAGVSTNMTITVVPDNPPQLQSVSVLSNSFQFQFTGEVNANYVVQYTTNLAPPAHWVTLRSFEFSMGNVYQITDPIGTNETRFYRVLAQ